MAKKNTGGNEPSQQLSTAYPSTRSGERGSLEATTSFGSRPRRANGTIASSFGVATIGGGSHTSYLQDYVERMHKDIFSTSKKLELEKRRLCKLDEELTAATSEFEAKQSRYKILHSGQQDANTKREQARKKLEIRVEKAILTLSRGSHENELLREQIDQLRKERQNLNVVYKQLEKNIHESNEELKELKRQAMEDKAKNKAAKLRCAAIEKVLTRERDGFQVDVEKLKVEAQKEDEVQKEQEKLTRSGDTNPGKKGKKNFMVADEEELFSETLMHRRILKLSFLNTIQRRHIKQHKKNIEVFEQAFATIKSSTGISDIEEIVKIFVLLEQKNFSLLTYVNQLNREIEARDIGNRELQNQLAEYQKSVSDSQAGKGASMKDLNQQIAKTQLSAQEKSKVVQELSGALEECRPAIRSTTQYLKKEIPALLTAGYDGDAPAMKNAAPDEHEENLSRFLAYMEEAVMQFRLCLSQEALQISHVPQFKPPDKTGMMVRPADLPTAHNTGDDSDDDVDTGLGDRPLPRTELRDRALAVIQRKRKKPGAQQGKPSHCERTTDGSAEEGVPGAAGGKGENEKDGGAQKGNTLKDLGDGGSLGAVAASPSGGHAEAAEDAGDRKEMFWKGAGKEGARRR